MTGLNHIVEINRAQEFSEMDTFTEGRYLQFAMFFPRSVRDILDIGCNTGRGGRVLKKLVPTARLVGLDCVPQRLARLDRRTYDWALCAFAHTVPLPNESFDAIVAGEFLEHVPPELVGPTLCELFRLLRLKGLLLLTTPNPGYLRNKIQGASVLGGVHVSQHRPRNLKRRLEDIGFSRVKIRGSGRMSRVLGQHFPLRMVYGSYLAHATKW
jgi:SAM-dependent methyltransferase